MLSCFLWPLYCMSFYDNMLPITSYPFDIFKLLIDCLYNCNLTLIFIYFFDIEHYICRTCRVRIANTALLTTDTLKRLKMTERSLESLNRRNTDRSKEQKVKRQTMIYKTLHT